MPSPDACIEHGAASAWFGEVWLSDYAVPPLGSWTTQCVRLSGTEHGQWLSIEALGEGLVKNARPVLGCECPRELKRWTNCGVIGGQGGGSACQVF